MRALIAIAALSTGCDQLFQLDSIEIVDAPPKPDANLTDPPRLVSVGFTNAGDGPLMTDVTVTMDPVQAGHLLVVAVCEIPNDPLGSVTDDLHTKYTHASADAASGSPSLAAQLYYGIVDNSGAPTIDVHFTGPGASSIDVRAAEYANIDSSAPLEDASGKSMINTMSLATSVVVDAVPALLVAATCVGDASTGVDGFDTRIVTMPNGDLFADTVTQTIGAAVATAHQGGASGMIVQLAAFRGSAAR